MFLHNDTRGQRVRCVSCQNGYPGMNNRRSAIEFRGDEVHCCPGFPVPGVKRALMGVQSRVLGQQGWVNVL